MTTSTVPGPFKPDAEIARDYKAYQAAHQDKLIQLLDKYVVPPAP